MGVENEERNRNMPRWWCSERSANLRLRQATLFIDLPRYVDNKSFVKHVFRPNRITTQ